MTLQYPSGAEDVVVAELLYFAYGSNMDWSQMQARCPASRFVCTASLDGHGLCFPRRSDRRGCGVASIAPLAGGVVWGVVYAVTAGDLDALDGHEGYGPGRAASENRYNRRPIEVLPDGAAGQPMKVWTYVAVEQDGQPFLPNAGYHGQIIAGAAHWGLPADYLARLHALERG